MLGHLLFRRLSERGYEVYGTLRNSAAKGLVAPNAETCARLFVGVDATDTEALLRVLSTLRPDALINCVGIIKQLPAAKDPIPSLTINALLPHRLSLISATVGARLIHISTDCVFNGRRGNYQEDDISDATDLYGRSKFLGEVHAEHAITLRTSIIGHELGTRHGLVEWYLSQRAPVRGWRRAIYTGFPTTEFCRIVADYILPRPELSGLMQVSSDSIDKHSLLSLIKATYHSPVEIIPEEATAIDRSLDSRRFRKLTGYNPPSWPELITSMHSDYRACGVYQVLRK